MWDERVEAVLKLPARTHRESEIPSEARASIHSNEVEGPAEKRRSFKRQNQLCPNLFQPRRPKVVINTDFSLVDSPAPLRACRFLHIALDFVEKRTSIELSPPIQFRIEWADSQGMSPLLGCRPI